MENGMAKVIRAKRTEAGLTQEEFAGQMSVTKAAVSKWETGESYPDITTVPKIAAFFGISLDELFSFCKEEAPGAESREYSVGLYMQTQLADTSVLDCVTLSKTGVHRHVREDGSRYYDTTVMGTSADFDFLAKLQKAMKPGTYTDVLEKKQKDGLTEIWHCLVCSAGIVRFRPGDTAGMRRALAQLRAWGILTEDSDGEE